MTFWVQASKMDISSRYKTFRKERKNLWAVGRSTTHQPSCDSLSLMTRLLDRTNRGTHKRSIWQPQNWIQLYNPKLWATQIRTSSDRLVQVIPKLIQQSSSRKTVIVTPRSTLYKTTQTAEAQQLKSLIAVRQAMTIPTRSFLTSSIRKCLKKSLKTMRML